MSEPTTVNLGSADEPFRVRVERLQMGCVIEWPEEGRVSGIHVPPEAEVELAMAVCPDVAALVLRLRSWGSDGRPERGCDCLDCRALAPFAHVSDDQLRRIVESTDG